MLYFHYSDKLVVSMMAMVMMVVVVVDMEYLLLVDDHLLHLLNFLLSLQDHTHDFYVFVVSMMVVVMMMVVVVDNMTMDYMVVDYHLLVLNHFMLLSFLQNRQQGSNLFVLFVFFSGLFMVVVMMMVRMVMMHLLNFVIHHFEKTDLLLFNSLLLHGKKIDSLFLHFLNSGLLNLMGLRGVEQGSLLVGSLNLLQGDKLQLIDVHLLLLPNHTLHNLEVPLGEVGVLDLLLHHLQNHLSSAAILLDTLLVGLDSLIEEKFLFLELVDTLLNLLQLQNDLSGGFLEEEVVSGLPQPLNRFPDRFNPLGGRLNVLFDIFLKFLDFFLEQFGHLYSPRLINCDNLNNLNIYSDPNLNNLFNLLNLSRVLTILLYLGLVLHIEVQRFIIEGLLLGANHFFLFFDLVLELLELIFELESVQI